MEAISPPPQGLELLQTLPRHLSVSSAKWTCYIALGASLIATKGYAAPEVGETYTYARQLCQHLEDPHQLFPVLRGLWNYYYVRAEYQTAHDPGRAAPDPGAASPRTLPCSWRRTVPWGRHCSSWER